MFARLSHVMITVVRLKRQARDSSLSKKNSVVLPSQAFYTSYTILPTPLVQIVLILSLPLLFTVQSLRVCCRRASQPLLLCSAHYEDAQQASRGFCRRRPSPPPSCVHLYIYRQLLEGNRSSILPESLQHSTRVHSGDRVRQLQQPKSNRIRMMDL